MTVRYIGGGHKQKYRMVDFWRAKDGIPATVKTIEYDPNRSARICLLKYADGDKKVAEYFEHLDSIFEIRKRSNPTVESALKEKRKNERK